MTTWADDLRDDWPRLLVRAGISTAGALLVAGAVLVTNGNPAVPLALPIGLGVLLALVCNPGRAFSALLFCTLLFEQYQIFGLEAPVTLRIPFFENFNNSLGIPLPTNPVEVLLCTIGGTWLFASIVTRRLAVQWQPFQGPMLMFLLTLVLFMGFGLARGGVVNIALWEVRALFYLCIAYFVGSQVIRTHHDVVVNTWCILLPVSIKGFQGVWRWAVDLGFDIGDIQAITSHECAVFLLTSFIFSLNLLLYGGDRRMLLYTVLTGPTSFITFYYAQRRVAYGCLVFGVIISFLFLPRATKKRFLAAALPLIPVIALYFAVFWNTTSGLGMPVQQVRSIFGTDATGQVDSSNTYRDVEKFNLIETIRTYPAGVGFGNKYLIVMPLDEVDFPLWDYIPHNCILWMWVKMGFVGITAFFMCFGLLIIQAAIDFRHTTRPLYKSLQVMLVAFLVCQTIVAYYDLQLTFYRNMVYLGSLIAMMGPIHAEAKRHARESDERARHAAGERRPHAAPGRRPSIAEGTR